MEKDILNLIEAALTGPDYGSMYPAANSLNVLSISRLAWSVEDTVAWKLHKLPPFTTTFDIAVGKAMGEYIQLRLEDAGWIAERQIEYTLPYTWKDPKLNGIILMGHMDLWNPQTNTVIELKTSRRSSTIASYAVRQCAMYAQALHTVNAYVVKINDEINVYKLTSGDIERCVKDMIDRAYKVANILNGGGVNVVPHVQL